MDAVLTLPWDRMALALAVLGIVGMSGAVSWLARSYKKAKEETTEVLKESVTESIKTLESLKPLVQSVGQEVPRLHDTVRHEHDTTRTHISTQSEVIKGRLPGGI